MKISGTYEIPTDSTTAFQLLTNPDVLVRTVPGLNSLHSIDENVYSAELEVGIKAVKGRYKGTVKLVDPVIGEQFRLIMDGQGPLGFVQQDMLIKLEQISENQTKVICDGEATVGGVVAGIGQRMMSGVASLLMGQFFKALGKEAKAVNVGS
jgi:carbon monoxide dehydrogenase subunit G